MVRITAELVRKRAEHNDGDLTTLQEVALHQYDIEKIENLAQLCRHLEILLLQNNLISKIENLNKLKELRYLNLAVNNIRAIQGLDKCESLTKVDLTLNFVADVTTVNSLSNNEFLEEMYLTGNPCAKEDFYREYVIHALPRLKRLDGVDITKAERIAAAQNAEVNSRLAGEVSRRIEEEENEKRRKRKERRRLKKASKINDGGRSDNGSGTLCANDDAKNSGSGSGSGSDSDDDDSDDSDSDSEDARYDENGERVYGHSPEERMKMHKEMMSRREASRPDDEKPKPRKPSPDVTKPDVGKDGRILNRNEGKFDFTMRHTDDGKFLVIDLAVGKYVDTSLIDVDLQPSYVRVISKEKVFQLVLDDEIHPDASKVERSITTGILCMKCRLVKDFVIADIDYENPTSKSKAKNTGGNGNVDGIGNNADAKQSNTSDNNSLTDDAIGAGMVDYKNIVSDEKTGGITPLMSGARITDDVQEVIPGPDFIDDDDVPPLE